MSIAARRHRRNLDIWPGWVDAISNILIVFLFLLLVFVITQFFMTEAVSTRDTALRRLENHIAQLANLLAVEQRTSDDLSREVARLTGELQASLAEREALAATADGYALRLRDFEAQIATLSTRTAEAEGALATEQAALGAARDEIALLNQQISALREQMAAIEAALAAAEKKAAEQEVQIVSLGQRLNAALATRVQELSRYRSEFFGRLREILGNDPGIRIVGDRFVFQSEVLFARGSADLGEEGRQQILKVAASLKELGQRIPADLDWVLQVEGHTDRTPINTPQFPSNWELSTARALSVVRLMIEAGIPARRLSAAGFAEFQPLDDRDDEIAYRRNRRIELKLTQR
jgi:chemotaxis protein MotB